MCNNGPGPRFRLSIPYNGCFFRNQSINDSDIRYDRIHKNSEHSYSTRICVSNVERPFRIIMEAVKYK